LVEGKNEIILFVLEGKKNQQQKISLQKGSLFLCSGKDGTLIVADRFHVYFVQEGLAKCRYIALHKMRRVTSTDETVFIVDKNIVIALDMSGEALWEYWHNKLVVHIIPNGDFVELTDINGQTFRVSAKKGKLDKQWSKSTPWEKWDVGREGWAGSLFDSIEELFAKASQASSSAKARTRDKPEKEPPAAQRRAPRSTQRRPAKRR